MKKELETTAFIDKHVDVTFVIHAFNDDGQIGICHKLLRIMDFHGEVVSPNDLTEEKTKIIEYEITRKVWQWLEDKE